jgi:hypothetical protein
MVTRKYPKAKPFDFVQVVQDLAAAVKKLQLQSPGSTSAWTTLPMSNSWTGTLSARIYNGNQCQLSGLHLAPGTISSGITIATLPANMIPPAIHEFTVTTDVSAAVTSGTPRCAVRVDGSVQLFAIGATATAISIEATFPLDI